MTGRSRSREIAKAFFRRGKDDRYGRLKDRITYSYMTILTASLSKLSPKMIVYSFGSTLYWLNMAKMVTGSVADRVVPNVRHSSRVRSRDSMSSKDQMYTSTLKRRDRTQDCDSTTYSVYAPNANSRYKRAKEGKSQNGTKVAEETFLRVM